MYKKKGENGMNKEGEYLSEMRKHELNNSETFKRKIRYRSKEFKKLQQRNLVKKRTNQNLN